MRKHWFIFYLHWRVISFFYFYFCGDEPQNVSKWVRLFSLYIYRRKRKTGKEIKLPSLVFNLKVVLELFYLLFQSAEVLLWLIPFPSGEALVKMSMDFSLCIFLGLFSPFTFPSPSPLFFHPYSHSISLLIFSPPPPPFSFQFLSLFLWVCLFSPYFSDSFTTSHLSVFLSVYNSLFVLSITNRILILSAEVHEP